jgi:PAS domain S-box-containing protein
MNTKSTSPLIVGVGASAGGLEPFQEFLAELGDSPGIAIVFVQHLDPTSKSLLAELLSKTTKLAVVELSGRKKVKPNTLYICPPQQKLQLKNGFLSIVEPTDDRQSHAIDHFFYSIAEDQGEHGIGIIFSGAGSDGTLGLKAISDSGGLTFAQDAKTAKHDSMPRSAATTGVADHVLPPAEIAAELQKYVRYMHEQVETSSPKLLRDEIIEAIPAIADVLMKVTNHNFQHYKTNTLCRRIQRRMQVLKIERASEYVDYLQHWEEETQVLFRELLIGVTAFFRDPDAFQYLRDNVLLQLFQQRTADDPVRIWVAGCANGAEAYTIAMLCREVIDELTRQPSDTLSDDTTKSRARGQSGVAASVPSVQIFASDIDERALQIARSGSYPIGIEEQVTPDRLKRFFVKRGKRFHVTKEIRDMVLFSAHNLISDPPFSRQDLICCRNLLIYLGAHLQNKLIPLFHYALRPSGYLFLGPSENITSHVELFRTMDAKHRISQRKGTATRSTPSLSLRRTHNSALDVIETSAEQPVDLTALAQRIVLDEFAPKYAIIDESGQILNSSADLEKYVHFQGGDYQNNLIKMVHSGLRIALRSTLGEAKKTSRKVQHDKLSIRLGDKLQRVMLTVQPMPRVGNEEPLYMIVFHDIGTPVERGSSELPAATEIGEADVLISQLESELETTRSDLDKSMQDMEAANEELKSSNEELLSMNEELQSANEELETSKEEIRASSDAVARANSDLENLLRSTQIATVFLDPELRIRSFTPAIEEIYSLISTDVGRPLQKFVPNVRDMPPLPDPRSMHEGDKFEHTLLANSGRSFIRRVLPYQSPTGHTDGIVVTFTDVTDLRESEELFQLLVQASAQIVWITNAEGEAELDSPSWREFTGQSFEQWRGMGWLDAIHPDDRGPTLQTWQQVLETQETLVIEYRLRHHSGDYRWMQARAIPQRTIDGTVRRWVGMNIDIHERKQQHLEVAERESHLRRVIDGTGNFIGLLDPAGTMLEVNQLALTAAGITRDDVIGRPFWECPWWTFDPRMSDQVRDLVGRAAGGERIRIDLWYAVAGGGQHPVDVSLNPVQDSAGRLTHLVASGTDILERQRAERALAVAKERLDLSLETGGLAPWIWHPSTHQFESNVLLNRCFGFADDATPSLSEFFSRVDPSQRERVVAAIEESLRTGKPYHDEYSLQLPDGTVRHLRSRGSLRVSESGASEEFYGIVVDITERKQRELELANREAHLRRVINNQLGLVGVIDRAGNLVEVDDRSLSIANATRAQVIGKHFATAPWWSYDPAVAQRMRDSMQRAFAGEVVRYDVSLFAHGEQGVMIDFMLAPVFDDDGNVEYLIPSGVDIRERKAAEFNLQQRAKLAELHRSLAIELSRDDSLEAILQAACQRIGDALDAASVNIWLKVDAESMLQLTATAGTDLSADACVARIAMGEAVIGRIAAQQQPRLSNDVARDPNFEDDCWGDCPRMAAFAGYPLVISDRIVGVLAIRSEHEISGIEFEQLAPMSVAIGQCIDRIQSAKQLASNARRLEMALRAGGMAAWEWTPEASYWTPALFDLLGLTGEQTPSSELFFSLVHPDDLAMLQQDWQLAVDGADAYQSEFRIIRPDGSVRWVMGIGEVQRDATGQVVQIFGMNWDATEDHLRELALLESERRATEASESKSAFVANMSHEIRTPMTAILGYTDLLRDKISDPEGQVYLQTIHRNGQYLLEIINDILDLSKIEAGKLDIETERFRPARLVEDVCSIMEVRAREGGLTLEVEYDGKLPATIESDAKRLKQILINLVGNAIKFTRQGRVRIRVRYERGRNEGHASDSSTHKPAPAARSWNGGFLEFDVIDTGIGISDEQQANLFKPFSQGDSSVSRHYGGTGLGLAISHRLAEMLGGEISVSSTPDVGSTFTLTIPTGDMDQVQLVDYNSAVSQSHLLSHSDGAVPPTRQVSVGTRPTLACRVLVVDDRRDIRFLSRTLLTKAGAVIDECEDGMRAVEHITECLGSETCPDLILLDMQMPNLDGYQTARQLRQLGFQGPIIALTADAMQGDMNECLRAGCNDYLAKPIDGDRLIQLVATLTKRP